MKYNNKGLTLEESHYIENMTFYESFRFNYIQAQDPDINDYQNQKEDKIKYGTEKFKG